jgi:surface protein
LKMGIMFTRTSLSKISLGDKFQFQSNADLPEPTERNGVPNTGKWIREDRRSQAHTPESFMANYGSGDLTAGTYIGEVPKDVNLWGTAPYEFDDTTGVLTVEEGIIDNKTQPWKQDVEASKIKKLVFSQHVKLIGDGSWLFSEDLALDQLSNLEEIEGLSNLDTSEITSMQRMFYGCSSLLELDLSGFDTSKVTNMEGMFALCSSLKDLDLSSFHTELVKNMTYMVNSCKSLNQLDLSSFDTSGITIMRDMFSRTPISKLLLGDKFRFQMDAGLQQPAEQNNSHNTGKWIKEDKQSKAHTPESFMKNYGTEDLTAGTYIGEIPEVKLTGEINFSRPEGIIGKELSATITIAHEGSNYKAENITVDINDFLDSDYIHQQTFKFDDELVIETRSSTDNSLISKTTKPFTDETVVLEDLDVNNYYNVIISGIVRNSSKKTDNENYHINIGYNYPGNSEKDNIAVQGFYFIQSGLFGLTNVPEKLVFKDTLFSPVMKELIVKRLEPSWGMEVTDYRGTIGIEENIPADRSSWEIVATAKPFINEKGQSISQDVVGIIYTQNNQTTELSSDAETLIESHNVSGEIPQINHTTRLSWQEEEGFLAKVYNSKGIEPGDTLQAELTIELRSAP